MPSTPHPAQKWLRSAAWFDNPDKIDMTALYLERYLNFGLSLEELRSGRPIIGIAQTGSDLSPCNRHHLVLAERVRQGITMGTATTMNSPAEALGMSLPGSAAIPAPYRDRQECAYHTGKMTLPSPLMPARCC